MIAIDLETRHALPDEILVVDGEPITAREIMADPDRWNECPVDHPNGLRESRGVLVLFTERPRASFKHGADPLVLLLGVGFISMLEQIVSHRSLPKLLHTDVRGVAENPALTAAERAALGAVIADRARVPVSAVAALIADRVKPDLKTVPSLTEYADKIRE